MYDKNFIFVKNTNAATYSISAAFGAKTIDERPSFCYDKRVDKGIIFSATVVRENNVSSGNTVYSELAAGLREAEKIYVLCLQ